MQQGMKLTCLDDVFPAWVKALYQELPVKGKIYTLREFGIGVDAQNIGENHDKTLLFTGNRQYTVWVEELVNPVNVKSGKEHGFSAYRFAPIDTVSEENSEELPDVISRPVKEKSPQKREFELV